MHVLSTLDGKTILAAVAVILGVVILIKGMGTKPGGGSKSGSNSSNNNTTQQ